MKVITGGTTGSTQRVIDSWHMFQEALRLSGKSWPQEFIVQRGVYVQNPRKMPGLSFLTPYGTPVAPGVSAPIPYR